MNEKELDKMNEMRKTALKGALEEVYELCDKMEEPIKLNLDMDIRKIVEVEFLQFMMYLSASNGTIDRREAELISVVIGCDVTPLEVKKFIKDTNIYSTEFEQRVPVTFQIVTALDNMLEKQGVNLWRGNESNENYTNVSELFLYMYKLMAQAVCEADGNIEKEERDDWNAYRSMLENYINENLDSRKKKAAGTKNTDSVPAPAKKSSVAAPVKKGKEAASQVAAPKKGK